MKRERFDEFLTPDMQMLNGGLRYQGVEGMKAHYGRIWGRFRKTLLVRGYVGDERHAAAHLNTHSMPWSTTRRRRSAAFGAARHSTTTASSSTSFAKDASAPSRCRTCPSPRPT